MQTQTLQRIFLAAIFFITDDRMPQSGEMNANLVLASGLGGDF